MPHAEVVLHDYHNDRVVAVWNSFSGRRAGDRSFIDEIPSGRGGAFGPYLNVLGDGRPLTSVSGVIYDTESAIVGLVCVNFDRTAFDDALALLHSFLQPKEPRPIELFGRDWREQISLVIEGYCRDKATDRKNLREADRREIVKDLRAQALLSDEDALDYIAISLGVSRANVQEHLNRISSKA